MKIDEWKKILSDLKSRYSNVDVSSLKATMNKSHTHLTLVQKGYRCKYCKEFTSSTMLRVTFKKPQDSITVFQASILWCILVKKRGPTDYGGYHDCVAGKRFIENVVGWIV